MIKRLSALVISIFLLIPLGAQEMLEWKEGYYRFTYPDNFAGIEEVSRAFNSIRQHVNILFAYAEEEALYECRVTVLPDRKAFDAYLSSLIGETRNQFVFLKYSRPDMSELVLYPQKDLSGYEAFAGPSLNRQLMLQFLYSYTLEPPVWIRDGFQAWAERLVWNRDTGKVSESDYSPWIESARVLRSDPSRKLSIGNILSAVTGSYDTTQLYPQAWAFVSFILSDNRNEVRRFLHESFYILQGDGHYNSAAQSELTRRIQERWGRVQPDDNLESAFDQWLSTRMTFSEMVQSGVSEYNAGRNAQALQLLLQARAIRPEDPLLTYYLGLVEYAEGNYAEAENWYIQSLSFGAEASTVNWALGLNYLSLGREKEAIACLEAASQNNPDRYALRVEQLLKSLRK